MCWAETSGQLPGRGRLVFTGRIYDFDVPPGEENKSWQVEHIQEFPITLKKQKHVKDVSFYFWLSIFFHQIMLLNDINAFSAEVKKPQRIFPFDLLPFCFLTGVFPTAKVLHSYEVQFIELLLWLMPFEPYLRKLCLLQSRMFFSWKSFSFLSNT